MGRGWGTGVCRMNCSMVMTRRDIKPLIGTEYVRGSTSYHYIPTKMALLSESYQGLRTVPRPGTVKTTAGVTCCPWVRVSSKRCEV